MVKISNDNLNVPSVNATSGVHKIDPVQKVAGTTDMPPREKQVTSEKIEEAVRELNEHIQTVSRELHFSVDEDSGRTVIKVMDRTTQEVIRQIPNEEALSVARTLGDGVELKLFSEYT